jgi:hypothetical protein
MRMLSVKNKPLQNRIVKLSELANLTRMPSGVKTKTPKNAINSPFK